ncbi:MAG: PA3496 family putative envelope integrity protein [Thiohalomonadales bacterium]
METNEMSFYNEKLPTKYIITLQETKLQKQINARKRVEDYIAEKQLRKNINDFDYEF